MGNICCASQEISSNQNQLDDDSTLLAGKVSFRQMTSEGNDMIESGTLITQTSTDFTPSKEILKDCDSLSGLKGEREAKRIERAQRLMRKKTERIAREQEEAQRIINEVKAEAAKMVVEAKE